MKIIQILRTAFSNLRSNRTRTILTVSGIGVGIGAIVFLVSLGYGLQELTTKRIASIGAITTLDVGAAKQGVTKLDNAQIEKFKQIDKVDKVSTLLSLGAKAESQGKKTDVVVNAIDDNFFALDGTKTQYGGLFSNATDEIVISTAMVKALNQDSQAILNKDVNLTLSLPTESGKGTTDMQKTFKVIGILQDDSSAFLYLPLNSVKDKLPTNIIYNSVKVKVDSRDDLASVKQAIEGQGFTVTSIADTISQVDQTFRVIQIVLAMFGAIALLVAAIGMFNTMTIALLERTRDIGIMKAIGVRNRDVYRMFLTESTIIAFGGGIIGVVGGWLISKGINLAVNTLAKSVGGEAQRLFATPLIFVGIILVFSLLVGLSTGFYPSRRASKINPLDALRYE